MGAGITDLLDKGGFSGVTAAKKADWNGLTGEWKVRNWRHTTEELLMEFCHNEEQSNGVEAGRGTEGQEKDLGVH